MVQYVPHRVCFKPNRSGHAPSAWLKGHTFKGVMLPVSVGYVLASDGLRTLVLNFFFFGTSPRSNIMDDVDTTPSHRQMTLAK